MRKKIKRAMIGVLALCEVKETELALSVLYTLLNKLVDEGVLTQKEANRISSEMLVEVRK